jgi:hypothetical protein
MTQIEALDLQRVPEYLIVPEGGYIGLEPGRAMRSLGAAKRNGDYSDFSMEDGHEVLHASVAGSNRGSSIRCGGTTGKGGPHD